MKRNNNLILLANSHITIIALKAVNCYLLKGKKEYILIDSGLPKNRAEVEEQILKAGCKVGDLKLILLTHGDYDHAGNCLYLKNFFNSKIAMHEKDLGMVEQGDFTWNRDVSPLLKFFGKIMVTLFGLKLKKKDRFKPDILLKEGQSLIEYGVDLKKIYIPGHSKGSLGYLTTEGNLFCGDIFTNEKVPTKNKLIVDENAYKNSYNKLKSFDIKMVYPGHGKPFLFEKLASS